MGCSLRDLCGKTDLLAFRLAPEEVVDFVESVHQFVQVRHGLPPVRAEYLILRVRCARLSSEYLS